MFVCLTIGFSLKGALSLNWAHLFAYSLKTFPGRLSFAVHSSLCSGHPGCEEWWWGWRGRGGRKGRGRRRQRQRLFEERPWCPQEPHSQRAAGPLVWSPRSSRGAVHSKGCWKPEMLPPTIAVAYGSHRAPTSCLFFPLSNHPPSPP